MLVELSTPGPNEQAFYVNPDWVIWIRQEPQSGDPDAQPNDRCTLIMAGGRKDLLVKGSKVQVQKLLDVGLRR